MKTPWINPLYFLKFIDDVLFIHFFNKKTDDASFSNLGFFFLSP